MDGPKSAKDAAAILQSIPAIDTGIPPPPNPVVHQQQILQAFWNDKLLQVEQSDPDFKNHAIPIARIKKVMKTDDEVKSLMISAEAPIIFSKACEIFIEELTLRAWMHAEENKRRTLQKSDISGAVSKSDMYDFLIDIVPRDSEPKSGKKQDEFFTPTDQSYSYSYNQQYAQQEQFQQPGNGFNEGLQYGFYREGKN